MATRSQASVREWAAVTRLAMVVHGTLSRCPGIQGCLNKFCGGPARWNMTWLMFCQFCGLVFEAASTISPVFLVLYLECLEWGLVVTKVLIAERVHRRNLLGHGIPMLICLCGLVRTRLNGHFPVQCLIASRLHTAQIGQDLRLRV